MLKLLDHCKLKIHLIKLEEILDTTQKNSVTKFIFDYNNSMYYLMGYVFIESLIEKIEIKSQNNNVSTNNKFSSIEDQKKMSINL